MSKIITFQNVEKLVFFNAKLKTLLPDFQNTFNTWGLAQKSPELKILSQKMLVQFVNTVNDSHIKILSKYFNEEVSVEKIDTNVATHLEININEVENYLNSKPILKEALFIYREDEQLYISIWR